MQRSSIFGQGGMVDLILNSKVEYGKCLLKAIFFFFRYWFSLVKITKYKVDILHISPLCYSDQSGVPSNGVFYVATVWQPTSGIIFLLLSVLINCLYTSNNLVIWTILCLFQVVSFRVKHNQLQ